MNDVTLRIYHDVLIVSIFYLQNVLSQRIRSQAVAEIFLGPLKSFAFYFFIPMLYHKIIKKRCTYRFLMDIIYTHDVSYALDNAAIWSCGQYFVSA